MRKVFRLRNTDKLDLENAQKGICENCNNETWVRRIEATDVMHGKSRGFYNICFKCFGPQILWRKGGMKISSPLGVPYDELDDFLEKYFAEVKGE